MDSNTQARQGNQAHDSLPEDQEELCVNNVVWMIGLGFTLYFLFSDFFLTLLISLAVAALLLGAVYLLAIHRKKVFPVLGRMANATLLALRKALASLFASRKIKRLHTTG